MTKASESQELTDVTVEVSPADSPESAPSNSMQDYYNLQKEMFTATLVVAGIIFISVWIFYSLNTALNYLIGASTGVVYLRMLAKDVEQLGKEKERLSQNRFALFIGLIIVATQWEQLQILPIFLGFLTYKASLIYIMVQTVMPSNPK